MSNLTMLQGEWGNGCALQSLYTPHILDTLILVRKFPPPPPLKHQWASGSLQRMAECKSHGAGSGSAKLAFWLDQVRTVEGFRVLGLP